MATSKNNRNVLLDFIRGALMVWVIVDHFFYSAGFLWGETNSLSTYAINYWDSLYRKIAHPIVLFMFFFLSGVVSGFSKNQLKRAIKLTVLAVALFIITFIFSLITNEDTTITIGVLYCFAGGGFLVFVLDKIKAKPLPIFIVGLLIAVVGLLYEFKVITFLSRPLFFVVFNEYGYNVSADYFPLLPYVGYILMGVSVNKWVYSNKRTLIEVSDSIKKITSPVTFIGRTSLWWYFISQGVFVAVFTALNILGA